MYQNKKEIVIERDNDLFFQNIELQQADISTQESVWQHEQSSDTVSASLVRPRSTFGLRNKKRLTRLASFRADKKKFQILDKIL